MRDNWNEIVDILKSSSVSNRQELLSDIQNCLRLLGWKKTNGSMITDYQIYNPQIEMFARFKMKSSFHKTKRII